MSSSESLAGWSCAEFYNIGHAFQMLFSSALLLIAFFRRLMSFSTDKLLERCDFTQFFVKFIFYLICPVSRYILSYNLFWLLVLKGLSNQILGSPICSEELETMRRSRQAAW